ncbi:MULTISPECIES: glycosyltransferase [Achromobacter]|uniref:Glycosyl transferase family 1 n=1 Tax=Achromobacter spanius TaxID=217203 RepID=A0AAW3HUQ7_9BURK|nr:MULTISPECIES: glycosyltransferase [Achromobacter]ASC66189.1 glycosyl transferase family 1 [Achromobacter denitrificans]KNE22208.1 glycosyl transferase family 1 [Achromobacter spanius]
MRILYTNFHRGDGGGHTTYVLSLAGALCTAHDVVVAAPPESRLFKAASAMPGVRTEALDFRGGMLGALRNARRVRRLLVQERFDIVHVNGSADHRVCMLAGLWLGADSPAVVYTQHNDRPANSFGAMLRARLATDRVICVCEHTRRKLLGSAFGRCGLRTVRNGVDVERFRPQAEEAVAEARRRWLPATHADRLIVGSNAGTADYKRWPDMVEAVSQLPAALRDRIVVMVAGKPPGENQRRRVRELGMEDQVIFPGLLDDVRSFVAALDVGFVLSSEMETISFACREMMAMGVPVIVSNAGGLAENVHAGLDGWVVPARAPQAVAGVLCEILAQPYLLGAMGRAAREKALREFALSHFVADTHGVYLEALTHAQRPLRLA